MGAAGLREEPSSAVIAAGAAACSLKRRAKRTVVAARIRTSACFGLTATLEPAPFASRATAPRPWRGGARLKKIPARSGVVIVRKPLIGAAFRTSAALPKTGRVLQI